MQRLLELCFAWPLEHEPWDAYFAVRQLLELGRLHPEIHTWKNDEVTNKYKDKSITLGLDKDLLIRAQEIHEKQQELAKFSLGNSKDREPSREQQVLHRKLENLKQEQKTAFENRYKPGGGNGDDPGADSESLSKATHLLSARRHALYFPSQYPPSL
ncbi:hypothetical protein JCM16303_005408 [Sporobolomyces ruberrimus]